MANRLVFSSLAKIGYPLFKPKLRLVEGTEYLPTGGGYVIVANHVDWLDGFYIAAAIGLARRGPVHFLTSSNNYWWTTVTIQIPVDRRGIIDLAADHLRRGAVICNFIEGQRNSDRRLLPGKTGSVRMAVAAGVPIVPLGITCSPGRTMAQSLLHLMSANHYVDIRIGQPLRLEVPAGEITKEWLEQETKRLMETIAPLAGKSL